MIFFLLMFFIIKIDQINIFIDDYQEKSFLLNEEMPNMMKQFNNIVTQNQSTPKNLSKLVRINNQTKFNVVANPAKSIDCFDSFNCPQYIDFKNKVEFHLNDDNYFDTNISNYTNRKQHGTFNLNQRSLIQNNNNNNIITSSVGKKLNKNS